MRALPGSLPHRCVSLGADNLSGTLDDGNVRAIKIYFNGILKRTTSNPRDLELFYEYDVPSDLASGECGGSGGEDANGLRSRAERSVYVRKRRCQCLDYWAGDRHRTLQR